MPNTNDTDIAVNGSVQEPTNTDKLVVTIPEDLSLDEHERSLLAKGVNFIPTTSVTDEFQAKEDNEKFFRRLRLKAHFHETSEDTHSGAHGNQLNDTIANNSSDTDANNANQQQDTGTTGIIESLNPDQANGPHRPDNLLLLIITLINVVGKLIKLTSSTD